MYFFSFLVLINLFFLNKIQERLAADDALTYAALLMLLCLNMYMVFVYFHRNVIYILYFLYHAQSLALPILSITRKTEDISIIQQYFYDRSDINGLSPELVMSAAEFIFLSDVALIFWLLVLPKFKPLPINDFRISFLNENHTQYIILLLLTISISSKIALQSIGVWSMIEMEETTSIPPWADTVREFSRFDIVAYLIIGYYRQYNKHTLLMSITYMIFMPISIYFAFLTTSKAEIIKLGAIIVYNKIFYAPKKDLIITLIIAGSVVGILFPLISYMRLNAESAGGTIEAAIEFITEGKAFEKKEEKYSPLEDGKLKRVDYFYNVGLIIGTYEKYKDFDDFKWEYSQNIIGLIPRMLYPDKPLMGLDYNELGKQIGAINQNDETTSIGFSPFGESWYFFGIYGIIFTPFFIALVVKLFSELFDDKKLLGRVLHYYLGLELARKDTFMLILPFLLKPTIFILMIVMTVNHVFPDKKGKNEK